MQLFTYYRSTASWRVRIALNLKGLAPEQHFVHLTKNGGGQHSAEFTALNPEHLLPVLRDGDETLTQSLAILEYLEEQHPAPPLLPAGAADRAWVRALALQVACDIHPVNNLRVLQYLEQTLGLDAQAKEAWVQYWVGLGLAGLEAHLAGDPRTGLCCYADTPTLADCCLVPQLFNARRFKLSLAPYPTLLRIESHLNGLEAFQRAAPAAQPDAE